MTAAISSSGRCSLGKWLKRRNATAMPPKKTNQSMPPANAALAIFANRTNMPGLLIGILPGLPDLLCFFRFFMMLPAVILLSSGRLVIFSGY
jgi:hypothetical protein